MTFSCVPTGCSTRPYSPAHRYPAAPVQAVASDRRADRSVPLPSLPPDECGSVESVKAVSDIYAPVSGKITERNADLSDTPELVNQDPYGEQGQSQVTSSAPRRRPDVRCRSRTPAEVARCLFGNESGSWRIGVVGRVACS